MDSVKAFLTLIQMNLKSTVISVINSSIVESQENVLVKIVRRRTVTEIFIVLDIVLVVYQRYTIIVHVSVRIVLNNVVEHHLIHIIENDLTQINNNHIFVSSDIIVDLHQDITIFFNFFRHFIVIDSFSLVGF